MPVYTAGVQGYTNLTQQTRLVLETSATPGEQLLMPLTTGASTMSLTTQPNTISATTGMHLHFYIIGNATSGSIGIVGTNGTGGAQTSITYHVGAASQNVYGYSEFTTKEAWGTVTASSITLTTLTPCQVVVFGSFAGKYLLPITTDKEEKITKFSPQDKRGILAKNFRVVPTISGVDVAKMDSELYPDSLWAYYMAIGNTPTVTTIPAAPPTLLAALTKAATMTLTTGPTAPGMFFIFTIASNSVTGTIALSGTDNNGLAASETITVGATNGTFYSTKRYSALTSPGANQFTTTGLSAGATVAVTGVFAWQYSWTYDGLNNYTPYSAALEVYDGVEGVVIPGTVLSDLTIDWQKEKEITLQAKGTAQDYLIVGDPTSTSVGTNPFATLSQPNTLPYVSWPGSFYIDAGAAGTPLATQIGTLMAYKLQIMTGRKWEYAGDGFQRPSFVTWDSEPDFSVDADLIFNEYQDYNTYYNQNNPMILGATFQGNWLGMISTTNYYETVTITTPAKIESFHVDYSKNPVSATVKIISEYSLANLGYYYKIAVVSQTPPTYTA